MEKYIPVSGEGANALKVKISYNLGGMNYFTCNNQPRGYYLSVCPVMRELRGTCVMESYTAFSGVKVLLNEVKRKSKSREQEAKERAKAQLDDLVQYVCEKNNLKIEEEEE